MKESAYIVLIFCNFIIILSAWPILNNKTRNPEEMGGYFEGDMILPSFAKTLASRPKIQRWKNGIVPYEITSSILPEHALLIVDIMRQMENLTQVNDTTIIQFRPMTASDSKYIIIRNGTGCSATVGTCYGCPGANYLNLMHTSNRTCMSPGVIQHELLHVLGFYHEQSRPDRDTYVTILYSNIEPGFEYAFDRYASELIDTLQKPYDYESIMHYDTHAFSKNGFPTILPKRNTSASIGQREQMSTIDIEGVKILYGSTPISTSHNLLSFILLFIFNIISIY